MQDIRTDVDLSEYHSDTLDGVATETLNFGTAKAILKSEKHAWAQHPRFGGKAKKVTFSMRIGSILDEVMTNAEKRLVRVEHEDFRTKAAQALKAKAESEGKVAVTQKQLDDARERAKSVEKSLHYHGIDFGGMLRQVLILWDEQASNGNTVQCRTLLDYVDLERGLIWDLKSTGSVVPCERLTRHLYGLGYHLQCVIATRAVEQVMNMEGRVTFQNVLVETEWPYESLLTQFSGKGYALGAAQWQRAIDRWECALRTNKWPGIMRSGEHVVLDPPAYLDAEMYDDDDDSEGGKWK